MDFGWISMQGLVLERRNERQGPILTGGGIEVRCDGFGLGYLAIRSPDNIQEAGPCL
jgi:hypothetical protein